MIIIGDRRLENEIGRLLGMAGEVSGLAPRRAKAGAASEPAASPADDPAEVIIMNSAALSRYSSRKANELRALKADRKLLVVINEQTVEKIVEAVQIADGVIFRHINLHRLPAIIALMKTDHLAIPAQLTPMMIERNLRREMLRSLSPAEQRILRLLAHGCSNHIISATMHINVSRVKYLIRSLLKKLLLQNRTQAAVFAAREITLPVRAAPQDGWLNGGTQE
ncbi:MAG TPA: LuxR C-terminal-related transcriptional regulator [Alphaproteobacteria bacterium]|jgi:two-component system nitrate/nitrite response regulator NarL